MFSLAPAASRLKLSFVFLVLAVSPVVGAGRALAQNLPDPEQPTFCSEAINTSTQMNPVGLGDLPGVTRDANGTYRASSLIIPGDCLVNVGGANVVVTGLTHVQGVLIFYGQAASDGNGGWSKNTYTFETGSLQVDKNAYVSANGNLLSYDLSGGLRGAGATPGYNNGAGGSYGGAGGAINQDGSVNTTYEYGLPAQPTDYGSDGFTQVAGTCSGPGAGSIHLIVDGATVLNGIVNASGGAPTDYKYIDPNIGFICTDQPATAGAYGSGSGGSIWFTTQSLSGSGSFHADGGSLLGVGSGGGGRAWVEYTDGSQFTGINASTATYGGSGPDAPNGATNGTILFANTTTTLPGITVAQSQYIPPNTTLNYNSLTVQNGAVLTIGAGSTLNVTGALVVTGNSQIVLQSGNTAAQVNGQWAGYSSLINAGSVQVDGGSSINADTQGYAMEAGPGAIAGPGSTAGGSYGGEGGRGPTNADGSRAFTFEYGSARQPSDLGSGGWAYGGTAGSGGGLVRLNVTGSLVLNGTISAEGQGASNNGAGSGGSVYVTAGGALTGSGSFHADGGNSINSQGAAAGGGGGRVYVAYVGGSGFTGFASSSANGGTSDDSNPGTRAYLTGTPGTVAFDDTTEDTGGNSGSLGALMVDEPYTIPAGTTATFDSITVTNGAVLTVSGGSALTVAGNINVTGNSQIQLGSINNTAQVNGQWAGLSSTLSAASVNVDAGSSINADGLGYAIEAGPGAAAGPDQTTGGTYGGVGGRGPLNADGSRSTALEYGSPNQPTDIGSGGWEYEANGAGAGGGSVDLTVSGALTLNGIISANGQSSTTGQGAGSGGSVFVKAASVSGSGTFQANGGNSSNSQGGAAGGGGGRVAVYTPSTTGFTGFTGSTASGGTSDDSNPTNNTYLTGTTGTIAFFDTSTTTPSLSTYQRFTLPASSTLSYTNITATNGSTLIVGGGSTVNVAGTLLATGNSTVQVTSVNNTAQVNNQWVGQGGTINAATVQVDSGSFISADAQGYVSDEGPGAIAGAGSTAGGSYGGAGGRINGDGTVNTSYEYGSESAPVDLGSGGWNYSGTPGAGGGAIRLNVSGALALNGTVSANGQNSSSYAGSGSGGSIYITAGTVTGAGTFQARGGSGTDSNGANAGAGGGRIAVYSPALTGFTGAASSSVAGGTSASSLPGTQGTLAFFDTSVPNNNVSIYAGYTLPPNSSNTFNNLTVAQDGNLTLSGGAQMLVSQTLHLTGTITAQSINTSGQVNGQYAGKGISILAYSAQIDATGVITADGQGYAAETGPGAEAGPGSTAGGSYGGLGGRTDSTSLTYGSATQPVDLGSGGWQYGGTGGAGGGAIELLVSTTLTLNGTLTASGQDPTSSAGGGAGGSVFVAANTINGSGSISANGGTLPSGGAAGGGGGRVSLLYVNAGSFPQTSISVAGGASDQNGTAGTVNFQQQPYSQWVLPVQPAIHGTTQLEWFTDAGGATAVSLAGPRTQQIATGAGAISTSSFDTTAFPDGAYQLRLSVYGSNNQVIQVVTKDEVINNSVVWHSGTLTANAEWTAAKVHALDGNVIVPNGITLTIDPSAIVKALPGTSIIVQSGGTLNALGTSTAPVIFTTFDDSSIGGNTDFNAGSSVPQPGEWQGIVLQGTGVFNSNGNTEVLYTQALLSGTLPGNESLQGTRVYTITGTLTVPNGVTLNIQPGAVVKFGAGAGIDVQAGGTLNANGSLAQPIYMTSINDSSIGGVSPGSDGSLPIAGDWNTVEIDGGTATFNYVHMLYGGGPQNSTAQAGMIETGNNANVTISNSELAYAFFIGLQTGYPNGGGDTVTVTNTIFHSNEDRAVNTYSGSTVHVVNDTFDSNAAGVFNHGGTVDVENSVVTNSTSAQFGNIGLCCGGTYSSLSYNDAYTTVSGVANYVGTIDPTGTNGNIAVAPVYMNGAQLDYRPTYGSPLIDAANGTVTDYPTTDAMNDARYNDPQVSAKTGKPDTNGNYPDIGAYEFVQSAPSNLDLTVSNVQGPRSAIVGQQATITYTVTNIGQGTVTGPWHDSVYLVADPNSNGVPVLAQTLLQGQGTVLGPGASYQATAAVTVPGAIVGSQQWQVRTNVLGEVFEGANTGNNSANSLDTVAIDLQEILPGAGALTGSFAGDGQSAYYKVVPPATQTTQVQLALSGVSGTAVQLFIGAGYVPTPQHYDYTSTQFSAPSVSAVIPAGATQTYYVEAYAEDLASAPAAFSISAASLGFSLTAVSPGSVPNAGDHTFTFTGGGFSSSTTFSLVDAAGDVITPTAVYIADAAHADVTFHFNYAIGNGALTKQGSYSATATIGTQTLTLPNAVQVLSQLTETPIPAGKLQINLDVPQAFRAGFPAVITVNYTNISGFDTPAPIMVVQATNATLAEVPPNCSTCSANYAAQYENTFNSGLVLAISSQGPAGILSAGGSGSIQFLATPTGTAGTATFAASEAIGDIVGTQLYVQTVDYNCPLGYTCQPPPAPQYFGYSSGTYPNAAAFCAALVPGGQSAVSTTRACMQVLNNAGFTYTAPQSGTTVQPGICSSTYGINCLPVNGTDGGIAYVYGHLTAKQLSALLAADATAFSAQGDYVYDVQKLLAFELNKDGLSDFNQRMHLGSLGYGFTNQFDLKLSGTPGALTETLADGSLRTFNVPSQTAANTWAGGAGDPATATQLADGSWNITDPKVGQTVHFIAGQSGFLLDSAQGPGKYSLHTTYTGNLMTGASDNVGNSLALQYDAQGHVIQSVDAMGRKRTFAYTLLNDSANSAFLKSSVTPAGTYTYQWSTGGSHGVGYIDDSCIPTFCEPAVEILSEALADSTHLNYTYNAAGRLISQSKDDNAEQTSFAYADNGALTMTDGSGVSTTVTPGANGIALLTDSMGNQHRFKFDAQSHLVGAIGALGGSSSLTYDASGNLSGATRPGGSVTSLGYNANGFPATLTGPLDETYSFGYDGTGNMTSFKDPSGQGFTFTYDANGNTLTRTNRRGQTTTYTYNAANLLTSVTLSTGAKTAYTYDSQNNLLTVAGPAGTIQYTYDSQNRISAIANPDGTQLTYTYNANGQRSSITDSTGFTVNSAYDSAGRLSGLTGGNGAAIVSYTYDGAGKVSSQSMGNGTSTTYSYDANGKVTRIVHKSASGASLGEYDYTHDANMQTLTETTPAGINTLQYDLDDQVVGVTTSAGQWQYAYDRDGNRTSVSVNGVATNYAPNNLDEYTSVGSSAYLYDADGNLVSGNGYTYTYDENNQLTSAAGSNDAWTYTYNALGNRTSVTHNGVTTRYLIDPSGYGNIVATFSGTGAVQAHYIYGVGLTSVVPSGAAANYYDFDARGNTVVVTGPNGAAVNSYSYLPFGEKTASTAGVTNLFTFNGMYGVTDDGPGLYGMRRRAYSPALGRFLQQDPTLFGGRDTNLYRYVGNNPMQLSDPCGSCWKAYDYFTHGLNGLGGAIPGVSGVIGGVVSIGTSLPGAVGSDGSWSSDNIHDATSLGSGITGTAAGGLSLITNAGGATELAETIGEVGEGAGILNAVDEGSQVLFEQFGNAYYYQPGANGPLLFAPTDAQVWHMDDCPPQQAPVPPDTPPVPPPPAVNIPHSPNDPVITFVAKAIDPNGKLTSGYGDQGYVPAGAAITYTIYFENQSSATAPAQKVTVTDALPKNLDYSTVQLQSIAFNNVTLSIPAGVQTYQGQATVSTDPNHVAVNAVLNPSTGVLTWTMQSVDPATQGPPANPLAGFLPPNNSANAGVGSVTFSVKPLPNQANAATVTNQASIVFDANVPIITNTVTNQLDTTTPTSVVAPLPATSSSNSFTVSWSGSDPSGSGIASYNVYVATDGGQYVLWQSATTTTSATYDGAAGHSYSFVCLATNNVGTQQTTPGTAATTTVSSSSGLSAVTVSVTPASASILQSQALSVIIAIASVSGTPTGSVVLSSGTYTSTTATLSGGSTTIVVPGNNLAVGNDVLMVTYTPDAASSPVYQSGMGSANVQVNARTVQVTLGTSPATASFTVDGTTYNSTQTFTWTLGSSHALGTTSPQTAGGVQETFTAWSDSGAITHNVTATAGTTSYTATFATAYLLTTAAAPAAGGTVTPAGGSYYPAGTAVPLVATPAAGYAFSNWTGAVANPQAASTTVSMTAPQTMTANFSVVPAGVATFTPGALTFNSPSGVASTAQAVVLSNTGSATLPVSGFTITGAGASTFAQTNNCGSSLAVGATCNISVVFTPSAVASYTASLSITTNGSGMASAVKLTGNGTGFTLSAAPTTLTVHGGSSATYTVTVAGQGGALNVPVALTLSGLPPGATATFSPTSVIPGSTSAPSELTITTTSSHAGLRNGPLQREAPLFAFAGLALFLAGARRRRRFAEITLIAVLCLFGAGCLTGCGTQTQNTYTLTITGTGAGQTQSATVQIIVQN